MSQERAEKLAKAMNEDILQAMNDGNRLVKMEVTNYIKGDTYHICLTTQHTINTVNMGALMAFVTLHHLVMNIYAEENELIVMMW